MNEVEAIGIIRPLLREVVDFEFNIGLPIHVSADPPPMHDAARTHSRPIRLYRAQINANDLCLRIQVSRILRPNACSCPHVQYPLWLSELRLRQVTAEYKSKYVML